MPNHHTPISSDYSRRLWSALCAFDLAVLFAKAIEATIILDPEDALSLEANIGSRVYRHAACQTLAGRSFTFEVRDDGDFIFGEFQIIPIFEIEDGSGQWIGDDPDDLAKFLKLS
jgi:hypothetical protein